MKDRVWPHFQTFPNTEKKVENTTRNEKAEGTKLYICVSVPLMTMKISQWVCRNFCSYCQNGIFPIQHHKSLELRNECTLRLVSNLVQIACNQLSYSLSFSVMLSGYLNSLVIWPRDNFSIIKLNTQDSSIMTPK